jgi:hypothetical protein
MVIRRVWAVGFVALAATLLTACGGSGTKTTSSSSTSSPAAATSSSQGAATSTPGGASKALPAPCTLITKDEAANALGSAVTDGISSPPDTFGKTQCAFNVAVGVASKNVLVTTIPNFAANPSYLLPSNGAVPGIGDQAFVSLDSNGDGGTVVVRVGTNVFEINVNGYDHPVTKDLLQNLARSAVGRL